LRVIAFERALASGRPNPLQDYLADQGHLSPPASPHPDDDDDDVSYHGSPNSANTYDSIARSNQSDEFFRLDGDDEQMDFGGDSDGGSEEEYEFGSDGDEYGFADDDAEEDDKEHTCHICTEKVHRRGTFQTKPCAHLFCCQCWKLWDAFNRDARRVTTCPVCRKVTQDVY